MQRKQTRHGTQKSEHKYEEEKWQKEQDEEQEKYVVKQRDGAELKDNVKSVEQETCDNLHVLKDLVCETEDNKPDTTPKNVWCGGAQLGGF